MKKKIKNRRHTSSGSRKLLKKQTCSSANDIPNTSAGEGKRREDEDDGPVLPLAAPLRLPPAIAARAAKVRRAPPFTSRLCVCMCVCEGRGRRHACKSKHRPRRVCLCNSCRGYDNTDGNSGALCVCVRLQIMLILDCPQTATIL